MKISIFLRHVRPILRKLGEYLTLVRLKAYISMELTVYFGEIKKKVETNHFEPEVTIPKVP